MIDDTFNVFPMLGRILLKSITVLNSAMVLMFKLGNIVNINTKLPTKLLPSRGFRIS